MIILVIGIILIIFLFLDTNSSTSQTTTSYNLDCFQKETITNLNLAINFLKYTRFISDYSAIYIHLTNWTILTQACITSTINANDMNELLYRAEKYGGRWEADEEKVYEFLKHNKLVSSSNNWCNFLYDYKSTYARSTCEAWLLDYLKTNYTQFDVEKSNTSLIVHVKY